MIHQVFCSECDCDQYDCEYNMINADPDDGICQLTSMKGTDKCVVYSTPDDSLLNISTLEV